MLKQTFSRTHADRAIEIAGLLDRTWSWLFTPFAMAVLYHYWVDGKIWRMRQAPELRHAMLHGPS